MGAAVSDRRHSFSHEAAFYAGPRDFVEQVTTCDLVQIRTRGGSTVVRLHMRLPA